MSYICGKESKEIIKEGNTKLQKAFLKPSIYCVVYTLVCRITNSKCSVNLVHHKNVWPDRSLTVKIRNVCMCN